MAACIAGTVADFTKSKAGVVKETPSRLIAELTHRRFGAIVLQSFSKSERPPNCAVWPSAEIAALPAWKSAMMAAILGTRPRSQNQARKSHGRSGAMLGRRPKKGDTELVVRATDGEGKLQISEYRDQVPDGATGLHCVKAKVQ